MKRRVSYREKGGLFTTVPKSSAIPAMPRSVLPHRLLFFRRNPSQQTFCDHTVERVMFHPLVSLHSIRVTAWAFSRVPGCRGRLSEVIASVLLWFSVWYGAKKRETHRIECPQLLTFTNNPVKPIKAVDESPVFHLPIFHDSLDDIGRMCIHLELGHVNIPKQILRKLIQTILCAHNCSIFLQS